MTWFHSPHRPGGSKMEIIHGELDYFGNNSNVLVTGRSTNSIFIDATTMTYLLVKKILETCMVLYTEELNCFTEY